MRLDAKKLNKIYLYIYIYIYLSACRVSTTVQRYSLNSAPRRMYVMHMGINGVMHLFLTPDLEFIHRSGARFAGGYNLQQALYAGLGFKPTPRNILHGYSRAFPCHHEYFIQR